MASADSTSTLDIDKALDVASRRMVVAIMKEKALNFEKKGLTAVYITGRSNDVTCCCTVQHSPVTGLLLNRHTLSTEPTLLHDPMAYTQVLHTAGWSHIQLSLACVNINT